MVGRDVDRPERVDPRTVRIGLELEFALVTADEHLADFRSLRFATAQGIVDRLDPQPHPELRRGDDGIKHGRWYVEGDERFDDSGRLVDCVPKGLETRTPPVVGIDQAVAAASRQTDTLQAAAREAGHRLCAIGWNPYAVRYRPLPPYNGWERAMRRRDPVYLAPDVYMMSYGLDVNVSHSAWNDQDVITIARRLTALSPALVPFSFSTPFAEGRRAAFWSVRTAARTGRRPAAKAFVAPASVPERQAWPPLVSAARLPAERGRVEFKAFDTVVDPGLYPALVALVLGVVLAGIGGRGRSVPDGSQHAGAAQHAFADPAAADGARTALAAARGALAGSGYDHALDRLDAMLASRRTPAHDLVQQYEASASIPLPRVVPWSG